MASYWGKARTLVVAPPTSAFASRMTTDLPALAKYVAATRPLCPPPIIATSKFVTTKISQFDLLPQSELLGWLHNLNAQTVCFEHHINALH